MLVVVIRDVNMQDVGELCLNILWLRGYRLTCANFPEETQVSRLEALIYYRHSLPYLWKLCRSTALPALLQELVIYFTQ